MAQDGCPRILAIEKFIQKEVHRGAEWVERKVADVFRKREQRKCHAESDVREGRVDQDARHKHDDGERMEEFSTRIDAQRWQAVIHAVHHLSRDVAVLLVLLRGRRRSIGAHCRWRNDRDFLLTIDGGTCHPGSVSASARKLTRPTCDADGGQTGPVRNKRGSRPPRRASSHPQNDVDKRVSPSEAPSRPSADHAATNDRCQRVKSRGQQFAVKVFFGWKPEAVHRTLSDTAREDQEWREQKPCEERARHECELKDEQRVGESICFDERCA